MAEADLIRMSTEAVGAKLTHKQRAVVDILVTEGCTIGEAGIKAGYAPGNPESARVQASRTLSLPHVQAYLFKRTAEEIGISAARSAAVLRRLSQSAKSEYVQLEASKDLLDRAGFKPQQQAPSSSLEVQVVIDLSEAGGGSG